MTCRHSLPSGVLYTRVLGLVLSPRFCGEIVLDGFGIAPAPMTRKEARKLHRPTSFRSISLRRARDDRSRDILIQRLLARTLRQHAPTFAVVGLTERAPPGTERLRDAARQFLAKSGIPVVEMSLSDVREHLLGRIRGPTPRALPDVLVSDFFPDLSRCIGAHHERYERHAWNALGLALVGLARHQPLSAAALIQPRAKLTQKFSNLLAHGTDDFTPDPTPLCFQLSFCAAPNSSEPWSALGPPISRSS